MSNILFTSDTHFGHQNIIQYCNRGKGIFHALNKREIGPIFHSVEQMNAVMVDRWNEIVQPDDEVYHLGDFAMGPSQAWPSYFKQLNGKIHLVYGNHDCDKKMNPRPAIRECGFASINSELYLDYKGIIIWMHHFPYGEIDAHRGYERPKANRNWDVSFHGHVHDAHIVNKAGSINVGCDVWEFKPHTFEQIIERVKGFPDFKDNYEKIEHKLTIIKA